MTDFTTISSALQPADAGAEVRRLMEEILFRDPNATFESSVALLNMLSDRFCQVIERNEFDSLLACAAHRAKVDLGALQKEQLASEVIKVLTTLIGLLTMLIGEYLALQQFRNALEVIAGPVLLRNAGHGGSAKKPPQSENSTVLAGKLAIVNWLNEPGVRS